MMETIKEWLQWDKIKYIAIYGPIIISFFTALKIKRAGESIIRAILSIFSIENFRNIIFSGFVLGFIWLALYTITTLF